MGDQMIQGFALSETIGIGIPNPRAVTRVGRHSFDRPSLRL